MININENTKASVYKLLHEHSGKKCHADLTSEEFSKFVLHIADLCAIVAEEQAQHYADSCGPAGCRDAALAITTYFNTLHSPAIRTTVI